MKELINVNDLIIQNKIARNLNYDIPTALRELRRTCGKSMENVAEACRLDLSTLKRKLKNKSPIKTTGELVDLCIAMQLDIFTIHALCDRFTEGRYLMDKACLEELRKYIETFYKQA